MARRQATWWHRNKYGLSALILILPAWFYYQSLHPQFPAPFPAVKAGEFEVVAMPYDEDPPYLHDGVYVKDFLLMFSEGEIDTLRQAYLNIGESPLPLNTMQEHAEGILHGTRHGQHVHALARARLQATDKMWLTLQYWDGRVETVSWNLP